MSTPPAVAAALVAWLKSLPPWGKGVMVGGVLVFAAFAAMSALAPSVASGAFHALKARVVAQEVQLDRMEKKLDQLLLKLIPNPK